MNILTYADFKAKYSNIPLLKLPIKRYWFNKIWNGEKKEEYRNINSYYEKRLEKYISLPDFSVGFRAGYRMDSPFVVCRCRLKKGLGFEEWGAEKDKKYYILEIIKVYKNI